MKSPENIRDILGVFHDGRISNSKVEGGRCEIEINIPYLAERITPKYRTFRIRLEDFQRLKFLAWCDEADRVIPDYDDLPAIIDLKAELLSAEVDNDLVRLTCSVGQSGLGFTGGSIEFYASDCRVFDESGREWTFDELVGLADKYWNEWEGKNQKAHQIFAPNRSSTPTLNSTSSARGSEDS